MAKKLLCCRDVPLNCCPTRLNSAASNVRRHQPLTILSRTAI